jgi:predicted secreted protein
MMKRLSIHIVVWGLLAVLSGCQQGKQANAGAEKPELRAAEVKTADTPNTPNTKSNAKTATANASKSAVQEGVPRGGKIATLTVADDGREITLRPGQTVNVVLASNHSTGFAWAVNSPTAGVIVPEGKGLYAVKSGSRGTETWRFLAMKPGRQTVRLDYRREWTQNMPERTFRFTAIVK